MAIKYVVPGGRKSDWAFVTEVRVKDAPLDEDMKKDIIHANQVLKIPIIGETPEAQQSIDQLITGAAY